MSMRPSLVLLASICAACASSGAKPDDRLDDLYTGTVTGVVELPAASAGHPACASLEVYATADDGKGDPPIRVGRPAVHQGSGHCSYEILNLPPGPVLAVHVEAPASSLCGEGSSLSFAPEAAPTFALADQQERTENFRAQCGGRRSSL
ncbi:MAG TPA: hypothetical protein VEJ89_08390 [Myxococcaceae bacterium]|jgi:hypothetical protein|nr:hypothetical protein [Myxococcaceae bacterium]